MKELCENGKWDVGVGMDKLADENDPEVFTEEKAKEFAEVLKRYSLNDILEMKSKM